MGAQAQGAAATNGRWLTISRTLCFVFNGDDVLLMRRAPNRRVFPNRYNGVGGHIERGEDALTCARREIAEETGLAVQGLRLCAVYNIDTGEDTGITLFVFTAWSQTRAVVANDEGTLHWVGRAESLTLDLVEDLPHLLPRLFALPNDAEPGRTLPYFVHVHYDEADQMVMQWQQETE